MSDKLTGVIKSIKGKFGFIDSDGEDIFFPLSAVPKSIQLEVGDEVEFIKEEVPEEKRKKPDQKWRASEIRLVGGESEAEQQSPDSKPSKSSNSGWEIHSLDSDGGRTVQVHGKNWTFFVKPKKNPAPPLFVKHDVPIKFSNKETGEAIVLDETGRLPIDSEVVLIVTMVPAHRGRITFQTPGGSQEVWQLEYI